MARWLVSVTAEVPYPWEKSFTVERSSAGSAASDGIKMYRKAVREKFGKAKKIEKFSLKVIRTREIVEDEG